MTEREKAKRDSTLAEAKEAKRVAGIEALRAMTEAGRAFIALYPDIAIIKLLLRGRRRLSGWQILHHSPRVLAQRPMIDGCGALSAPRRLGPAR
jgi:hypothetical protein